MLEFYREGDEIKSRIKKPKIPNVKLMQKKAKMMESTAEFWKEQEAKKVARAAKKAKRKATINQIIRKFIK